MISTKDKWSIEQGYSKYQYDCIISSFSINNLIEKYTKPIFHYTSFENCLNILKFQKGNKKEVFLELYATHFSFLNDIEEFWNGFSIMIRELKTIHKTNELNNNVKKIIKKFLKDIEDIQPPHYIISFNTGGNNLSQWKYYGKNCGVAIEFDTCDCKYFLNGPNYMSHDAYRVIYDDKKKNNEIKQILEVIKAMALDANANVRQEITYSILRAFASVSFMKNKHYKHEDEVRLLFAPFYDETDSSPSLLLQQELMKNKVFYRKKEEYIAPYLKIKVKHKDDKPEKRMYPVKSLTVGPGQNQKLIYNALIMFVQTNFPVENPKIREHKDNDGDDCESISVNGIKVRRSLIPFRG